MDKALILAGGLGTRLRSEVSDVPKPMAPIQGEPFLSYLLSHCRDHKIRHVYLSVGYMKEKIIEYYGHNFQGLSLEYIQEVSPKGTGGAISYAVEKAALLEPFFVFNGDSFFDVDLMEMKHQFLQSQAHMSMALYWQDNDPSRYGKVKISGEKITEFLEKGSAQAGLINGGVYYLSPQQIMPFVKSSVFSFEKDLLEKNIKHLEVQPFTNNKNNFFLDIGMPADYQKAQNSEFFKNMRYKTLEAHF